MQPSRVVFRLSGLAGVLAAVAAGAGLFWPGGDGASRFTSIRGEEVEVFGRGIYRYDALFTGAANRGTDAATLLVALPALAVALRAYRRGSARGAVALSGVLAYLFYVYASYALGATAYNGLYLVYLALFSITFFALTVLLVAIDGEGIAGRRSARFPDRVVAAFLVVCGVATAVIWFGMGLLPPLIQGETPEALRSYATLVTDTLDLGIITPATLVAAWLIRRGDPRGVLLAFPLLGILVLLGPAFVAQPIFQTAAGVTFTPAEVVGPIAGFGTLAAIAIWLALRMLRQIPGTAEERAPAVRPVPEAI